jgi:hypothetical protein
MSYQKLSRVAYWAKPIMAIAVTMRRALSRIVMSYFRRNAKNPRPFGAGFECSRAICQVSRKTTSLQFLRASESIKGLALRESVSAVAQCAKYDYTEN